MSGIEIDHGFDHEKRLAELLAGTTPDELAAREACIAQMEAEKLARAASIHTNMLALRKELVAAIRTCCRLMITRQGADRWETCASHCIECACLQRTAGSLLSAKATFVQSGHSNTFGLSNCMSQTLIPALAELVDIGSIGSIGSCGHGKLFTAACGLSAMASELLSDAEHPHYEIPAEA